MARSGVPGFVSERLRQAREARVLSVAALAERVGCTAQAVYKWERGGAPRADLVPAIAQALAVDPSFFFRDAVALADVPTFFRSRLSATKSARRGAQARMEWLVEIADTLEVHVELPAVGLPDVRFPAPLEASDREVERAAREARAFFQLGHAPVPNVVALMEAHGVIVSRTSLGEGKLDAFSTWTSKGRPIVFLNADKKAAVRSRFDAAHELGHLLMHRGHVSSDFLDDKDLFDTIERQANLFASAFLLPEEGVRREVRVITLDGLLAAKPRWGVSVQALLKRAQGLGLIDESSARWQWVLLSRRGWRTGEPLDDVLPAEQPSLLRQAFQVLRDAGVLPEADMVIPTEEVEALCALPPGYLAPRAPTARVLIKTKEAPHRSS